MHIIGRGGSSSFQIKKMQTANALELEGKNKRLCKQDARAVAGVSNESYFI